MILVSGYYGYGNLGDEAILAALCRDLESLGVSRHEIVVPSGNPEYTKAVHGVAALGRFDLAGIWRTLASARCLVSGGGSLLQDVTSRRSLPYYLTLVELALLRRVPVVMYAQGLGPIQSKVYRSWTVRAFRLAAACSVRDGESLCFLQELGLPEEKVILTADPVFAQGPSPGEELGQNRLLLNLRPYQYWPEQKQVWLEHLARWRGQGWTVEFVPVGPGDGRLGAELKALFPELKVHPQPGLDQVTEVFQGADLCLSMRLHGVIFSALSGCQPVGISYDPKVAAICRQLAVPHVAAAAVEELAAVVDQAVQDREEWRGRFRQALGELQGRAELNRQLLAQVLR